MRTAPIEHVYIDCARKIGMLCRLQRKIRSTALLKIFIRATTADSKNVLKIKCSGEKIELIGQF